MPLPQRVKRADLPFQVLNSIEKEANKQVGLLLDTVLRITESEVMSAQPDLEEAALVGTSLPADEESLRKSFASEDEERRSFQPIRDYNRRVIHGAPRNPAQLTDSQIKRLISVLNWEDGQLHLDPERNRTPLDLSSPGEEIVVPTYCLVYGNFKPLDLEEAFKGKGLRIEVVAKKGSKTFLVTKGNAVAFACVATYIPAVRVLVRYQEPSTDTRQPEIRQTYSDAHEQEVLARNDIAHLIYNLPSYLEPLAEQARTFEKAKFLTIAADERSDEEAEARDRAIKKDDARRQLWLKLYNAAIESGLTPAQANKEVRFNDRWIAAEALAEKSLELAARIEDRWDQYRSTCRKALALARMYVEQDGEEFVAPLSNLALYNEANKPHDVVEESLMGDVGLGYTLDERVEIRDLRGDWRLGTVVRLGPNEIRVRRDDGQYRAVADVSAVRREGEGKLILGIEDDPGYTLDMKEIRIPKFNVIIPAGSNSLKIERALEPINEEMNRTSLQVNKATWERNLATQELELEKANEAAHAEAGRRFRTNSSKDCGELLFTELGLPIQRVNQGTGQPAVDKESLQALDSLGEKIAGLIITAREAQSKLSQLQKWEPYATAGTVQAHWNTFGTPMGRYTCDTPNLQNRIVAIRETIEAPLGFKLVSLDLGQAEYVTWASLSGDPILGKAFIDGTDFHERMYDEVRAAAPDVDLHQEDPRKSGKTINFALLYQMQAFVLAKRLGVTTDSARKIMEGWQSRAEMAFNYRESVLTRAIQTGQISTQFGRTRYMPQLKTAKGPALHEARKTAFHHHNCGTAAEIVKIKQIKTWRRLRRDQQLNFEDVRIGLQMHDEIILIVKDDLVDGVRQTALEAFEEPIQGFLPFKIDVRIGQNWMDVSK